MSIFSILFLGKEFGNPSNSDGYNTILSLNDDQHKRTLTIGQHAKALRLLAWWQVEFVALSQRTSQSRYGEKAEAIMRHLHNTYPDVVWYLRRLNP